VCRDRSVQVSLARAEVRAICRTLLMHLKQKQSGAEHMKLRTHFLQSLVRIEHVHELQLVPRSRVVDVVLARHVPLIHIGGFDVEKLQ
jgi:hypothetical protein